MEEQQNVKYCVCAMLDLLGFSSHLEISAYDLRTSIGIQAVKRLQHLEDVLHSLNTEREKRPEYYPNNFHLQRINDAVFITMDLDDVLIPSIGSTAFNGLSTNVLKKKIDETELDSLQKYESARNSIMQESCEPLIKFTGFIARLHMSINKIEAEHFFPGAKTVISTGFRRSFLSKLNNKEDYFSANFSLSNAYLAEKSLSGPNLYVDTSILQLVSFNQYANHLLKFGHFQFKRESFDCFGKYNDVFFLSNEATIPGPIEIKLFRKDYQFRILNPSPLAYLQNIPKIQSYLINEVIPDLSNIYYKHIYNAIKLGINKNKNGALIAPKSFVFNGKNDFGNDIGIFYEFLSTGKSETLEELAEKKFEEEYGHLTAEGRAKVKALWERVVEIDFEPIALSEVLNGIFDLDERQFDSFLLVLEGDLELLDYKNENLE